MAELVEVTEIYQQLTVLLVLATVSHFTFKRFRQPTIIGEIAIGIVLGPSILGALGIVLFAPALIQGFAALGAIFLLFMIGLESDFRSIYTKMNFFVALGGVLMPLLAGFVAAWFMVPLDELGANGDQFTMSMFVGATLVATSTAIAAAVLLELGLMREQVARTIMGAAVVDDILGLLVLSMVVGLSSTGAVDLVGILVLVATAVIFIVVAIFVGVYFFSRIVVRIQVAGMKLGLPHGGFLIAMAITFFYALMAEVIGLSAIIGAFLAGSMFSSTPLREDFMEGTKYLGAVFTPIFFVSLGLLVNLTAVAVAPALLLFASVLVVVSVLSKVAGCGVPALMGKLSRNESLAVGWGMTPRGEVGLIVALTALNAAVIGNGLFSVIVLVIVAVSIMPAPFLRKYLLAVAAERRRPSEAVAAAETT